MGTSKNIALLLGNGINVYKKTGNSWKELLKKITGDKTEIDYLNNSGAISYPEFFDITVFNKAKRDNKSIQICNSEVKNQICMEVKKWEETDLHKDLVKYAESKRIPILTTNYDMTLEKALTLKKKIKKRKLFYSPLGQYKHFRYPWHQYYSDKKIDNSLNSFAIWHIHGFIYYPQSLIIGADDYASIINHAKDYINNKKDGLYASLRNNTVWKGNNSWLNIIFHKDLYIIGLSLDSQETGLRWLLIQREKYFRDDEKRRKKTVYVHFDNKDLSAGKKFFFNSLGIEIKQLSSYDDIYFFMGK
ncbi:MAG: SIR2 family protein [Spirochaetia bacterium]|nr:SIR2 family protein [Spirochaetia bacterium]